jgi:hypothetical protein
MKKIIPLLFLGLMGCGGDPPAPEVTKIEGVERVFFRAYDEFVVLKREGNQLKVIRLWTNQREIGLVTDVSKGEPMWVKKTMGDRLHFEIHIHNAADIEGGGFRAGKTQGTNTVVE